MTLLIGMSLSDVSGMVIVKLAAEELTHPASDFNRETLFMEGEVLEVTAPRSKPDRSVVKVKTDAYKQDGTLVATFKRAVLVPRRPGAAEADPTSAATPADVAPAHNPDG